MLVECILAFVCAFVHECTCVCARAAGAAARHDRATSDVCHHVGMCMCECMNVHMDVRVDSMPVCVRVRTCARVGSGTRARPPDVNHYVQTSAYV